MEQKKREKREDLPADPKAMDKWRSLPQGAPSKEALPPATGGISTLFRHVLPRGLLWLFALFILLSLIAVIVSRLG